MCCQSFGPAVAFIVDTVAAGIGKLSFRRLMQHHTIASPEASLIDRSHWSSMMPATAALGQS